MIEPVKSSISIPKTSLKNIETEEEKQSFKPKFPKSKNQICSSILNICSFLVVLFYFSMICLTMFTNLSYKFINDYSESPTCSSFFLNNFSVNSKPILPFSESTSSFFSLFFKAFTDLYATSLKFAFFVVIIVLMYFSMFALSLLFSSNKRMISLAKIFSLTIPQLGNMYVWFRHQFGFVVWFFFLGTAWLTINPFLNEWTFDDSLKLYCPKDLIVLVSSATDDTIYLSFFMICYLMNYITNMILFILVVAGIVRCFLYDDQTDFGRFKQDLRHLKNFLNRDFKKDLHILEENPLYEFRDKRMVFEIQGSIIFIDFAGSKCFLSMNFPQLKNEKISFDAKVRYILNMVHNHKIRNNIVSGITMWVFAILNLIILLTNFLTGLFIWISLFISSPKTLLVMVRSLLIYLPLIFQCLIILIRSCTTKYKKGRDSKMFFGFKLKEENMEDLSEFKSSKNQLSSNELQNLRISISSKNRASFFSKKNNNLKKKKTNKSPKIGSNRSNSNSNVFLTNERTQRESSKENFDYLSDKNEDSKSNTSKKKRKNKNSKKDRKDPKDCEERKYNKKFKEMKSLDRFKVQRKNSIDKKNKERNNESNESDKLSNFYEKYYEFEPSIHEEVPVEKIQVDEDKIIAMDFDYKFDKAKPFYRKLDFKEYGKKGSVTNNFKQLI